MSIALLPDPTPQSLPRRGTSGVRIDQAVAAVVETKRLANCRPSYVTGLRQYLNLFARGRESWPLAAFTIDVIEQWFAERNEPPITRSSNAGRLAALFAFAVRREWIEKNPCALLERVRIDRKPPKILTPIQCALIMDWCRRRKPNEAAFFALGLYAGVRPDELARLSWSAINLDDGTLTIDAATSKIRQRRIVALEPSAIQWLRWAKERGARLPVKRMTRLRYLNHAKRVLGLDAWPQDIIRHTAASQLLALHQDAGKVAYLLGNSVRILETNYRALVTAKDCLEFWSFLPESPRPEKPKPVPAKLSTEPIELPETLGVTIDPSWTRFERVEAALKAEHIVRALAQRRMREGSYHGGAHPQRMSGERIDTIREIGKLAGCSRQTVQYAKHIVQRADPDVLDSLRRGKVSIAGVYSGLSKNETSALKWSQSVKL